MRTSTPHPHSIPIKESSIDDHQKSLLTSRLKQAAREAGFDLAGACPAVTPAGIHRFHQWLAEGYAGDMHYLPGRADAYEHPDHILEGARSLLLLAATYRTAEPRAPLPGQGRVSRYAWGADYHDTIHARLRRVRDALHQLAPRAACRAVVDTAPLLEREFAQLAGLGWIGKNTLLLNRQLGSWFFLAALITDQELDYDQPHAADHCGTCRACLDACPTQAFVQPYVLDSRRCISYLTIELRGPTPADLRSPIGDWLLGCDICQEVCPWNHRSQPGPHSQPATQPSGQGQAQPSGQGQAQPPGQGQAQPSGQGQTQPPGQGQAPPSGNPAAGRDDFRPADAMNPIDLASLFHLDDAAFRRRFRHTPLWRPKRRGILRNAAIILGNQRPLEAIGALSLGLDDYEPLVRAACAWALGQYNHAGARRALTLRQPRETDPDVLAELNAAL